MCPEPTSGGLNRAPGKAIDDPGVARVVFDKELPKLLERIALGDDSIEQVRTIIASGEDPCRAEPELRDDVAACGPVRGGRERHERHPGKALPQGRQLLIFGAEIMTPVGDAMCFVDGKESEAATGEKF